MSRPKEVRCPICGALYNVEPCVAGTHAGYEARQAERECIVRRIRDEAAKHEAFDRERIALLNVAELIEFEGRPA